MHSKVWSCLILSILLLAAVLSSGCIAELNPTPNEVKIRGNIISVDPAYVSNDIIWMLLISPNMYEPELFSAVDTYLPRDNPVIELGCGIGALSVFINDRISNPYEQVSVEPNPYLQDMLEKTKENNSMVCTFLEAAVAYGSDKVEMVVSNNILSNHVSAKEREDTVQVKATTVEEIANNAGFTKEPITLIMSIVGSEHSVILKESNFISNHVGCVISAVYEDGKANAETFNTQMTKLGFTSQLSKYDSDSGYTVVVYTKDQTKSTVKEIKEILTGESVSAPKAEN